MARRRNKQEQEVLEVTGSTLEEHRSTNATTTNQIKSERGNKMAGLTAEQIQALLGKTRTKGGYIVKLKTFLESGENGCDTKATWPELAGKKSNTLKQGFEGALSHKDLVDVEGMDQIKVIKSEEDVFLVNLAQVEVPEAA